MVRTRRQTSVTIADPRSSAVQVSAGSLVEDVGRMLRGRGERMTGPRMAVLRVLATRGGHVGAEEVVLAVAAVDPSVHRASVYRTLETLTDLGVVQHVHVGHGGTAYHLVRESGAHLHAQCSNCGAVYDLPADLLDAVAGQLSREHGFLLDPAHVALSGVCATCRNG
jgi:Fur family transcriptional regulator, ferric uptake regulator